MKPRCEITKCCALCEIGRPSPDGGSVLCTKNGVMARTDICRKFRYDPLKRDPELPKKQKFEQSDFDL